MSIQLNLEKRLFPVAAGYLTEVATPFRDVGAKAVPELDHVRIGTMFSGDKGNLELFPGFAKRQDPVSVSMRAWTSMKPDTVSDQSVLGPAAANVMGATARLGKGVGEILSLHKVAGGPAIDPGVYGLLCKINEGLRQIQLVADTAADPAHRTRVIGITSPLHPGDVSADLKIWGDHPVESSPGFSLNMSAVVRPGLGETEEPQWVIQERSGKVQAIASGGFGWMSRSSWALKHGLGTTSGRTTQHVVTPSTLYGQITTQLDRLHEILSDKRRAQAMIAIHELTTSASETIREGSTPPSEAILAATRAVDELSSIVRHNVLESRAPVTDAAGMATAVTRGLVSTGAPASLRAADIAHSAVSHAHYLVAAVEGVANQGEPIKSLIAALRMRVNTMKTTVDYLTLSTAPEAEIVAAGNTLHPDVESAILAAFTSPGSTGAATTSGVTSPDRTFDAYAGEVQALLDQALRQQQNAPAAT